METSSTTEELLLSTSLQALKPPPLLTVSDWSDTCRVLSRESSAEPGRYKTSRTPYLKEIMDSVNDHKVEFVVFMKSAQVRRHRIAHQHHWLLRGLRPLSHHDDPANDFYG